MAQRKKKAKTSQKKISSFQAAGTKRSRSVTQVGGVIEINDDVDVEDALSQREDEENSLPPAVEILDSTKETNYFERVKELVIKSPNNVKKSSKEVKKIITKDNIKIEFLSSKGKYDIYQANVKPSLDGENKHFICLLCAVTAAFRGHKTGLTIYNGK